MASKELSPELARKLAGCFRQYRGMKSTNEELTTKLASVEQEKGKLEKEVTVYQAIFEGISSGQIDPDDAEEKLAELRNSDEPIKIASGSRNGASVGIGRVHSSDGVVVEGEVDALTSYLLGTMS